MTREDRRSFYVIIQIARGWVIYKTKGFGAGATLLALVLLAGGFDLACGIGTTQTVYEIPSYYTTYTEEAQLFSISYPSYWETPVSQLPEIEQQAKQSLSKLKTGLPVENFSIIFVAGPRIAGGYDPYINIAVETVPAGVRTHNQMVAAELKGLKMVSADYRQLSRIKTIVDGREDTIIDWEGTVPVQGKLRSLQMLTLVDDTVWVVTCFTSPEKFSQWEIDFNTIVRSLRIYD